MLLVLCSVSVSVSVRMGNRGILPNSCIIVINDCVIVGLRVWLVLSVCVAFIAVMIRGDIAGHLLSQHWLGLVFAVVIGHTGYRGRVVYVAISISISVSVNGYV